MPPASIGKLDFDAHRQPTNDSDSSSPSGLLDDSSSFISNVAQGVVRRDRRTMQLAVVRYLSFACAMLSW